MSYLCEQEKIVAARMFVSGRVQGVGFRKFSQAAALKLHLSGTVKNLGDGRVELKVEGNREHVELLIQALQQGPHRSEVSQVDVSWQTTLEGYGTFSIEV